MRPSMPEPAWSFARPVDPGARYELLALHLAYRSWRALLPALVPATRLHLKVRKAPGFVGMSNRARLRTMEWWTLTIWDGVPALARFVHSPLHVATMRLMRPWLRAGAVARIPLAGKELPPAPADVERWLAGGRPLG